MKELGAGQHCWFHRMLRQALPCRSRSLIWQLAPTGAWR